MNDRILGIAALLLAAFMTWAGWGIEAPFAYEPVGPRAFPLLLAALMAAGGLWLLIKPGTHDRWLHEVPLKGLSLAIAAVFVYALLFQWLGFTLATVVMSVPVGMAFGGTLLQSLGGGIGLGLIGYFLFDKVLDVVLPTGVLAFVLGGR